MYNNDSLGIAFHNLNIRREKPLLWTPTEYKYLYKFHGTDTTEDMCLVKKYGKSRNNYLNKNQRNSIKPHSKRDRKKLLEIFHIRSNRDEKWTTDEANHIMKKWWGPEHLWTIAERAMFKEDETWLIDEYNTITEEDQENLLNNLMPYRKYNSNRAQFLGGNHQDFYEETVLKEAEELSGISNRQISDAESEVMVEGNYASDDEAKETCNGFDDHTYNLDTSSILFEDHPMVDNAEIVNNDGMDSASTVSAVREDEIDVTNENSKWKLREMIAYEKLVLENLMPMDVEEMQELMFR